MLLLLVCVAITPSMADLVDGDKNCSYPFNATAHETGFLCKNNVCIAADDRSVVHVVFDSAAAMATMTVATTLMKRGALVRRRMWDTLLLWSPLCSLVRIFPWNEILS